MSDRLPSHLSVGALVRRVNAAGGFAAVRAAGDPQTGAILVLLDEREGFGGEGRMRALERMRGLDDADALVAAGPADATDSAMDDYWRARRARDPDLWVVELAIAGGERFVAETICGG
ncbi:hypothetical protein ASG29_02740 [Sphingomonas sp. Leaf412]|uniref:DUF1491 family protein n=1 Tax=Sphingomonas sp. Leaf412 TaxID=1736370 RepID=UPI0006FD45A9|nr:DUF1491 family protein [Sphingomonas sp. Leaf412]KQT35065.1 hypothetical protein ASG29_02740 [Sphingomonas sp. Leaf412]